jgi:nitrogen regulatory protein P-II 1
VEDDFMTRILPVLLLAGGLLLPSLDRHKGHSELYRGAESVVEFHPKLKLELVVTEDQVEKVTRALCQAAGTGRIGDGKIFVFPANDAIRIRTGERGEAALS